MKIFRQSIQSAIGPWHLFASEKSLIGCYSSSHRDPLPLAEEAGNDVLATACLQLSEYFQGTRTRFDLPLNPVGTDFQQKVWNELLTIDYGMTLSYGELAQRIGDLKLSRAVGAANGANPISIIVPCHRVIAQSGHLTGYAGGIEIKKYLLDLENPLV